MFFISVLLFREGPERLLGPFFGARKLAREFCKVFLPEKEKKKEAAQGDLFLFKHLANFSGLSDCSQTCQWLSFAGRAFRRS